MSAVSVSKRQRIADCSSYLQFLVDVTKTKKKLLSANFCKDKFCPICSKNLAVKNFIALQAIAKWIHEEHNKEFIFVTLTAPNVRGDKLNDEIKRFNSAFNNYKDRKEIKAINKGFVRKLEVTYNAKQKTYHTHFHVLIAVNKSYFTDKTYVKRDKWLEMWREVMKDDSITQVDVRRVKDINKALLELCKYLAKDNYYLTSKDVFRAFYKALYNKRSITYGGLFKDGIKQFKEGNLFDDIDFELSEWKYLLSVLWKENKYDPEKLKELSGEELKKYKNKIYNDIANELE